MWEDVPVRPVVHWHMHSCTLAALQWQTWVVVPDKGQEYPLLQSGLSCIQHSCQNLHNPGLLSHQTRHPVTVVTRPAATACEYGISAGLLSHHTAPEDSDLNLSWSRPWSTS